MDELEWRWRPTPLALTLLGCAALALAVAVGAGRWQLVVFAAPLLGALVTAAGQRRAPALTVRAEPTRQRCFETESVEVTVTVEGRTPGDAVRLSVSAAAGLDVEVRGGTDADRRQVAATAQRWGRYPLRARLLAAPRGGLLTAGADSEIGDVVVFPSAPAAVTALPRTALPDRLGTHLTRHSGPGVEYADIRPYVPGDQLRTVNWPVSARRGSLHVTERLTDRAADVVVLVDGSAQPPGPATDATARMVEGAVQVAQSALRSGDRAGVVALGGQRPRWLAPDLGQRQFYRVLEAVLDAGGAAPLTGTLAPPPAVPPGAVVVAFSTLLDSQFGLALVNLYDRGHPVVVVDVLPGSPFGEEPDPLFELMWQLQRSATYRNLRSIGVNVVAWPLELSLEQAMRPLPRVAR